MALVFHFNDFSTHTHLSYVTINILYLMDSQESMGIWQIPENSIEVLLASFYSDKNIK